MPKQLGGVVVLVRKPGLLGCDRIDTLVTYVNSPEQFLQRGSNKTFSASIVKISILNEDVLDSEWALTSRALRLVCT